MRVYRHRTYPTSYPPLADGDLPIGVRRSHRTGPVRRTVAPPPGHSPGAFQSPGPWPLVPSLTYNDFPSRSRSRRPCPARKARPPSPAQRTHPRRSEQPGPGLRRGRGRADLHRPRRGRLPRRYRRQSLPRLHRLLGPDDPGPRPPGGHGGRRTGRPPRHQLRRPHAGRNRTGRADHRRRALDGKGPPGQLGHRGHDERHPPGPRIHRPADDRQVRRQLSRPRR